MLDNDLALRPAHELAALVRSRAISARELTDLYLDRIDRLNPPLNAVITLDADQARRDADRADAAASNGESLGVLHGLPITVKDAIEVKGIRSTGGARELIDHVPDADAPAVDRLRRAGAIIMGKTNVPRWSGEPQTFNDVFGTTNNPWDVTRTPAGSSGGAAAAVAAGFTSFEIGTDIGGSVRMPSHCCGVFGLKPSYGVISQRGYLDRVGGGTNDVDINVFGPIARSAIDLDLLLDVLAGPEAPRDRAWRLELPGPRRAIDTQWRVGTWFEQPGVAIDPEVLALLNSAAELIATNGMAVEINHPEVDFDAQNALFFQLISAAISPSMSDHIADAMGGSHLDWLAAQQRRVAFKHRWEQWFDRFDILLCPVLPTPAFPHDQAGDFLDRRVEIAGESRPHTDLLHWQGLIGLMELPSVVVPIGRTRGGLPVGMQIVAGYLRDREATAFAQFVERLNGGFVAPPGF